MAKLFSTGNTSSRSLIGVFYTFLVVIFLLPIAVRARPFDAGVPENVSTNACCCEFEDRDGNGWAETPTGTCQFLELTRGIDTCQGKVRGPGGEVIPPESGKAWAISTSATAGTTTCIAPGARNQFAAPPAKPVYFTPEISLPNPQGTGGTIFEAGKQIPVVTGVDETDQGKFVASNLLAQYLINIYFVLSRNRNYRAIFCNSSFNKTFYFLIVFSGNFLDLFFSLCNNLTTVIKFS